MKLSTNLSLGEVTKSNTAIKNNIPNEPTQQHLQNLKALAVNLFQPIREHFDKPIYISSGYRSKDLNKIIGGSSRSQHSKGEAIDIDNDYRNSASNREIFFYIKDNLDFDQLIWENGDDKNPGWVHVSYKSSGNRKKIGRIKGQKYTDYETD